MRPIRFRRPHRLLLGLGLGAALGVSLLAAPVVAAPATAPVTALARATLDRAGLNGAVTAAIERRAHITDAAAQAAGRAFQVNLKRRDAAGSWAFGSAVLTAPHRAGAYPLGWLFVAERAAAGWQVALEGDAGFAFLTAPAPSAVMPAREKALLAPVTAAQRPGARPDASQAAAASNNTGRRLPYAIGQTWTLTGGPHGWSGTDRPFSSIDLSGGDGRVLAAGGGNVYTMCGNNKGWLRIIHPGGYATDYYHLFNNIAPPDGTAISEGAFIGNIGTDTSCGGSASGPHVHFAIRLNGAYVAWNWRTAGKWVLWEGAAAYQGFALHGSTRVNVGGGLFNYGALGANQGIVDANGGGAVNRRSGPGTGFAVVGSVGDGATITIPCWRNGTTHTGRYGTTSVWDKLTDNTWVSDAFVYTGVNTIGPTC